MKLNPCIVRWSNDDERRLPLAIIALAELRAPEARSVLELLARDHQSEQIRALATQSLSRMDAPAKGPATGPPRPTPR